MVRAFRLLLLLAVLSSSAAAQLSTQKQVSGTLQLPPGTPASNTTVRFQLVYCGGNTGRVNNPDGSVTIVSYVPWDLRTQNGVWSTPLYGSDQIICGTQQGTSRWRVTPIYNGTQGPSLEYQINSCAGDGFPSGGAACTQFDIDTAPQCGTPATRITNCVVQYPYVVPPPEPITGPPGPPGPPGPAGSNPGTQPHIAFYATDGTLVSSDPRLTDNGSLNFQGDSYTSGSQTIDSILYVNGAYYMDTSPSASAMTAAPAGRSGMGISNDGNFYISSNGATPDKICTSGNGACATGGANPGNHPQIAYYASDGTLVSGDPNFTDNGTTLSYSGNGYVSGNDTVDNILYVNGAYYMDTTPTTIPMAPAPAGRSGMGVSNDGNFYISANSGAPAEICTATNGVCATGGSSPGTAGQMAYYASTGSTVGPDTNFTDSAGTLSYSGNTYTSGNDTIDSQLLVKGAWYLDTLPAASAVTAAPAGRSSLAVNTDGAFYISENSSTPAKICTASNTCGMPPIWVSMIAAQNGEVSAGPGGGAAPTGVTGQGNTVIYPVYTPTGYTPYFGQEHFSTASGSTNTIAGISCCYNGNNSVFPMLGFSTFTQRFQLNYWATNTRYWWGLTNYNLSGVGGNSARIEGTSALATDTPNKTLLGWRASGGTDTTYKAVEIQAGASSPTTTLINTGVTVDLNQHTFVITLNATGTQVTWFIDGNQVATSALIITPSVGTNFDLLGSMFWMTDNKNTATNVGATQYYSTMVLRQ